MRAPHYLEVCYRMMWEGCIRDTGRQAEEGTLAFSLNRPFKGWERMARMANGIRTLGFPDPGSGPRIGTPDLGILGPRQGPPPPRGGPWGVPWGQLAGVLAGSPYRAGGPRPPLGGVPRGGSKTTHSRDSPELDGQEGALFWPRPL